MKGDAYQCPININIKIRIRIRISTISRNLPSDTYPNNCVCLYVRAIMYTTCLELRLIGLLL